MQEFYSGSTLGSGSTLHTCGRFDLPPGMYEGKSLCTVLHLLFDELFNVGRQGFDLFFLTPFKSAADLSGFSSIALFCLELDSSRCPFNNNMFFNVYFGSRSAFFRRRDEVP